MNNSKLKVYRIVLMFCVVIPIIFKGTVIDNIRYGRKDATDEECIKAVKTIYCCT